MWFEWILGMLAAVFGVGFFYLWAKQKRAPQIVAQLSVVPAAPIANPEPCEVVQRLEIGATPGQPILVVQPYQGSSNLNRASPVSLREGSLANLSQMLQAVPSLLTAGEVGGKHLMEVVINGELARASDGVGLRAFALGSNGIKEHAKLFEISNLQNVVNAAAIWQVASIVVAQKHLADISRKLDDLKSVIEHVAQFLDNQRRARVESCFVYLQQAASAIRQGELSSSTRVQIESCELVLLEIQRHLTYEFNQLLAAEVKHSEMFGTKQLSNDLATKIHKLNSLGEQMAMCLKTRIAAWYVLSLVPGESILKKARLAAIQSSVSDLHDLAPNLSNSLYAEIEGMKSAWNAQTTLDARKKELGELATAGRNQLHARASESIELIAETEQSFLDHDRPMRIVMSIDNNRITEARMLV